MREKLKDIVPLTVPLVVNIEPSGLCNIRCNYCMQSLPPERKKELCIGTTGLMSLKTFEDVVDGLKGFTTPPPWKSANKDDTVLWLWRASA